MTTKNNHSLPKVLLIDDHKEFHNNMEFLLEDFEIISAYNETEATNLVKKSSFDLIILDMNFDINSDYFAGLDLLDHFQEKFPEIPIITVTGFYEKKEELRKKSKDKGAKKFLLKDETTNEEWIAICKSILDQNAVDDN